MNPKPTTVSEVIALLENARTEWNARINILTESQLTQPNVCGWWSVKDVVAHIGWYENQMAEMLERRSLDTGTDAWELPLDERNARIQEAFQDQSPEQVLTHELLTYIRLLEQIYALSDVELNDPAAFAEMPADWSALELLRQNTWQHYQEHLPDIIKVFYP